MLGWWKSRCYRAPLGSLLFSPTLSTHSAVQSAHALEQWGARTRGEKCKCPQANLWLSLWRRAPMQVWAGEPLNSVPLIHPGVPLSFPGATPAGVTVPGLTLLDLCKLLHSWEQSCSLLTTAEENKSFQGLEDNELPISPTPILTSPTPFPLTSGKSPRSFSHHGGRYLFIYFLTGVMALLSLLFRS